MSGSQPWVLGDRLDWQGTDQFSGTDEIGYPDGCVERKGPLTIKREKTKGRRGQDGRIRHMGSYLQEEVRSCSEENILLTGAL